jgi:hypothetical protein
MRLIVRTVVCGLAALALCGAAPASAQYRSYRPSTGATGESWHVEFDFGTWSPAPDFGVSGASGPLIGSGIGMQTDLGLQSRLLKEFALVIRPGKKHKFRFIYEPISYSATTVLAETIGFGGQMFAGGATVATSVDWKSYTFGYEYDFIYRPRFFVGFITDIRYDNVTISLASAPVAAATRVRTPFPMLGGIVRIYPLSDVSLTAELTGFTLPGRVRDLTGYDGHAFDIDLYATFNFSNNFGVRSGYRSTNVYYEWELSHDDLTRRGPYVMGVVRF